MPTNLPPGPELNALVAVDVLGWHQEPDTLGVWLGSDGRHDGWLDEIAPDDDFWVWAKRQGFRIWRPSTDPVACEQVKAELQEMHPQYFQVDWSPDVGWRCAVWYGGGPNAVDAFGETEYHAVCLAAVKAAEVMNEQR